MCVSYLQLGIALGFLVPPMLVPNVDDMNELAHHIRTMLYASAGVASVLFLLVIIGKTPTHIHTSDMLAHAAAHRRSLRVSRKSPVMAVKV